jgi:hypothetical protein
MEEKYEIIQPSSLKIGKGHKASRDYLHIKASEMKIVQTKQGNKMVKETACGKNLVQPTDWGVSRSVGIKDNNCTIKTYIYKYCPKCLEKKGVLEYLGTQRTPTTNDDFKKYEIHHKFKVLKTITYKKNVTYKTQKEEKINQIDEILYF